jgi:uncharacterized protein
VEYRAYGNSGTMVSALGFGGMRFENPNDIDACAEVVVHAARRGITYFDTAPLYCGTKSEIAFAQAFKVMKEEGLPFSVSTKSNRVRGDELRKDLETSLKNLDVEKIDFYHAWCVMTMEDWELRKERGAVAELMKAKEEGLIGHVCFSTHLSGADIHKVVDEGYFEGVTLGYSAVNFPYREEGIKSAFERKLGVAVMNPLGGGVIVNNEKAFAFLKSSAEQPIVEAALHFLLADERISTILVGFRNRKDVDSAVAAIDSYRDIGIDRLKTLKDRIAENFDTLCTTCGYCNVCPEGIQPWKFMESANSLYLNGEDPAMRLRWHWDSSIDELGKCTKCGACVTACTQHIPILDRFEELKAAIGDRKNPKHPR